MDTEHNTSLGRRMSRKGFLKGLAATGALAAGWSIVGCQPQAAAPSTAKGTSRTAFEAETGGTSVYTSVVWIPFFVGEKLGYFAEEGIKQSFTDFKGGGDAVRGLATGAIQYMGTGIPPLANAFVKGETVKIIAGAWGVAQILAWIVPKDSPIKGIKDIKGKKVSISTPGSLTDFFARRAVKAAGLTPQEVQLIPVGSDADSWTAAKTGIIDVAWSTDVLGYKLIRQNEARILWFTRELVPAWEDFVIASTDRFIQERPDVLKGFVRAYQKSLDFVAKDREAAAKIWVEYATEIPIEIANLVLKDVPNEALTTKLSSAGLRVADEGMVEIGMTKEPIPWDKFIDQQFMPENLRIDISKR